MSSTEAQIIPLPNNGTKAILKTKDGFWGLYRERGDYLEPVGICDTQDEAEDWLGYKLPRD